jgi:hypothetical protein
MIATPELLERIAQIEGMTGVPSAVVFRELIAAQEERGPLLELGSYKGKSLFVLAACAHEGDTVFAVDSGYEPDWPKFGEFAPRVRYLAGRSEELESLLPFEELRGKVRFIHDDASHQFDNIVANFRLIDQLLSPGGVIAVDDYENPNYPQVPLAVGAAIFGDKLDLKPFLVCNNKAYLCRSARWPQMMWMTSEKLSRLMHLEYGMSLVRTDRSEMAPFSIRPVDGSDENGVYAPGLYGPHYTGSQQWADSIPN